MKYACVVPRLGLESDAEGFIFLRPLQPDQPGPGLLVFHLPEDRIQLIYTLTVENDKA